jgi:hypothetical protein
MHTEFWSEDLNGGDHSEYVGITVIIHLVAYLATSMVRLHNADCR